MTFKDTDNKPVIVLGAGGHARVVIDALRLMGRDIVGLTDPSVDSASTRFGVEVLGDDSILREYSPDQVELANGIGALPGQALRHELAERLAHSGFAFARVIHPSAVIANDVQFDDGVQIMAGVVIQSGTRIGASCIVNTGAVVDHDCEIERNCHIAPGVTLSGEVKIGEGTHVGTGASVIQGITIGRNCVIAAGSSVFRDVSDNSRYLPDSTHQS